MRVVSTNPPTGAKSVSELKARIEAERAGRPFLAYRNRDDEQRIFPFEPDLAHATVGRQPSSDLALAWDDQVSRLHAEFERVQDAWTVVDEGRSRNGTFVNGKRLTGRHRLVDGDTVQFGSTTMTFRIPSIGAQADAGAVPRPEDLSTSQHRVLVALCRPDKEATADARPATDQQIAEELFLSVATVRSHLQVLFAKFGIEQLPRDQQRIRLVEQALYSGLISERDL
jgi:pSer/pThr/pTyr-binding forkhead associated (FHA) protein